MAANPLGEILRRFRFHGVPGPPVATPVPIDRRAELERELEPVFAALESAQHQAADILGAAAGDAVDRRAHAAAERYRLIGEAGARSDAARTEAAAELLTRSKEERSAMLAAAHTEADRIERHAAQRIPDLVERVVREVLTLVEPPP